METYSMIRFNIQPMLKERGRTRYWLAKQMGMSYPTITKIVSGESRAVHLETIEVLCQVLECTPNDLFEINFDEPENKEP